MRKSANSVAWLEILRSRKTVGPTDPVLMVLQVAILTAVYG